MRSTVCLCIFFSNIGLRPYSTSPKISHPAIFPHVLPKCITTLVPPASQWIGITLPETNISHLKRWHPKRKLIFQFVGAKMLVSGRAVPNPIQEWKSEGSSCSLPRSFHHTGGLLQSFGIKYPTCELLRKIWGNCWWDISNTLLLRHIWRHTHNIPLTYPYRKMQNTYKNCFFWNWNLQPASNSPIQLKGAELWYRP